MGEKSGGELGDNSANGFERHSLPLPIDYFG